VADERDRALKLVDEVLALLDRGERDRGDAARRIRRGEPWEGRFYSAYTSLVRLRDKVVELREEINRLGCSGAGAGGR